MIIGIDVSPLSTAHKVRGIGFYVKRLVASLKKLRLEKLVIRELKNKEEIISQDYDLLHIPYFNPYFITVPWPWEIKKPMVVTIHDLIPVKYPDHYPPGIKGKLRWQAQKLLLKQSKLVITDSFASKYDINQLTGYPLDKTYVTYLAAGNEFQPLKANPPATPARSNGGRGTSKLEAVLKKYGLPDEFCLYVGDVNWNKNIPSLVKACEKINLPLVIVGKQAVSKDYDKKHVENKDLVWLQKKCSKLQSSNVQKNEFQLILTGFVSNKDLMKLYNLASVYCQPSFDEGFGLPVLEAMACGCPVVSSNRGSLPEVVGDAGILTDPTVDGLAKALTKVHSNETNHCSDLVEKGINRAKEFSWQKTAEKTKEVYKTALGGVRYRG